MIEKIRKVLSLLESSVIKEALDANTFNLTLDTTKVHTSSKGEKVYGNQSDDGLRYYPANKQFTCNIHAVPGMPNEQTIIFVKDLKTGKKLTFKHSKTDWDGSHEDIYGWNFVCVQNSSVKLLIIND